MKKITLMGGFLMVLLSVFSCKEGLESEIFGELNPTSFPSTESEYELYTMEVYVPFSSKWPYNDGGTKYHFFALEEGHVQLYDFPTDIMTVFTAWGGGWENPSRGNFEPYIGAPRNRSHFEKVRFVSRTTSIIGELEEAPDDVFTNSALQQQLLGEAHMARGWTMFRMLQMFGPVPVILDPELIGDPEAEADVTRPSRANYVAAIEADLQFAIDNLPEAPEQYGRFNRGLALTIMMRLHMHEKNFTDAEAVGREIQGMGYALVNDYESLFREATDINSETIWAVTTDPASQGRGGNGNFNAYSYYCRPGNFPGKGGWSDVFSAPWDFYDSFDPADARRTLLVDSYVDGGGTTHDRTTGLRGAIFNKYAPEGDGGFQAADIVIARYADVLLLLAEAINENNGGPTQEAVDLLNDVRDRAGVSLYALADFASQDAFNDAILQERAWELYFEGLRLPDLIRHGKWPSAVGTVAGKQPGPSVWPIPQYAVEDGVEQNAEYAN
ncbi:RagB/SusD family nutrient uptake outer membrane protein [Reichenbachiella ulvae]|uniref:RagB/SusD family nutrient uptake outer membrane protein n=1 Tax=Reichenbachiella ulvae TaxID=2980104 RepID=A0ABT3CTZ3_9BACT|nr:RagB/SusD family nutrient uptake outer membrane protein [Reichenbachiella ulvae]MCV9387023.1 RagB/SusD family nutrient uptake outer membrane protein [Reichenbachiella ulvae]